MKVTLSTVAGLYVSSITVEYDPRSPAEKGEADRLVERWEKGRMKGGRKNADAQPGSK